MIWWPVWIVLILGALAVLVVLGVRLYRQGKALAAEVERALAVAERLEQRMAELEELAQEREIAPELFLTPERRAELSELRAQVRATRRARRDARYQRVRERWNRVTG